MPYTGSPVSRLKTNMIPIFVIIERAGITRPSRLMSIKRGRRRKVEVPDVVMDELLVPLDLAGVRVDRNDAVAV